MMNDMRQILVVDDDLRLLEALTIFLSKQDWRIVTASDGHDALQRFLDDPTDLVLLDVMMPGMDGLELCTKLRQITDVPIIMLTARGQEYDREMGLCTGADDYLVKPFSLRDLRTRIEGLLQRSEQLATMYYALSYDDGFLRIDGQKQQVLRQGHPIKLSSTERLLLFLLAENREHTLPVDRILQHVWVAEHAQQRDYLKSYISCLRQKIEPNPDQPVYLRSEQGMGYCFTGQPAAPPPQSPEPSDTDLAGLPPAQLHTQRADSHARPVLSA